MRLPMSLAARVGAVAATAAIAVSGATVAANASIVVPVVQKIPTTLTISNSKPVAHKHQTTAIINGHLTAGSFNLRHLRVWLLRQGPKGHWYVTQTKLTRRHGHVFFRVHIFKRAVNFRIVFRGTRNFARAVSAIDTIAPATTA
jgi:hypothetical protein